MSGRGAKGGRPGGSCRECASAKRKCTHNCPGRLPTVSAKGGAPAGLTPGSNSSTHDQEPAPNPPKPAARRPGRAPGPGPPDVGRKNLFPRPGGESARVAAEEASRHKTSKPQGQSRADAASIILQTARCMKVQVDSAELSSWAKIVHWLRGSNAAAIVEMFGELTVPHFTWDVSAQAWTEHDVQCCEAGVQKDAAANGKRFGSDDMQKDFELLVLADVLRKSAVDTDVLWQLQSLHETAAWAAEHDIDIAALHEQQQAQMLGMSDGQMQSFVVEQSTQSRARYRANCKAVFEYVEGMAERNELYSETEHRSHINAMVRLMRCGICRSKYWTNLRKDYDWEAVLRADKAVAAAIAAGVTEEGVRQCVVDGVLDVLVADNLTQDAMARRPVLQGRALQEEKQRLAKLPLGSEAAVAGLSGEDVKDVKQIRMQNAEVCFRSFDAWEQTLHIEACQVCNRLLLADEAVPGCAAMAEKLVQQKDSGYRLCSLCSSATANAKARERRNAQTSNSAVQPIHEGLLHPWGALNDMRPGAVPVELQQLSMVERLCVALISPMMQIRFLRAGTRALNGNCIAFRQPVHKLATALPRYVSETSVLLVVRGLVADEDKQDVLQGAKDWRLRREVVRRALVWLLQNCPPYKDPTNQVSIHEGRLASLPLDGEQLVEDQEDLD